MKKTKIVSAITLSALLIGGTLTSNVSADTKQANIDEITTINQLDKAVEETNNMASNDKFNAIEEIIDDMSSDLRKELFDLSKEEFTINGQSTKVKNVTDNIQIFASGIDEEDKNTDDELFNPLKPTLRAATTKAYGNRRYTGTHGWNLGGIGMRYLKLVNHYKVDKNGLTMTSVDDTGTSLMGSYSFTGSIPDKYAEKVGYDINGRGKYTTTTVGGWFTTVGQITSTIKLSTWDKKNKKVTVNQSVKYSE